MKDNSKAAITPGWADWTWPRNGDRGTVTVYNKQNRSAVDHTVRTHTNRSLHTIVLVKELLQNNAITALICRLPRYVSIANCYESRRSLLLYLNITTVLPNLLASLQFILIPLGESVYR